jgi:hypothetical protein
MRVQELKELIKDKPDDEHIVAFIFDKSEANDHIWNNFINGEEAPTITEEEWMQVFTNIQSDDGIWQEFSETFSWEMDKIANAREAAKK